MCQSCEIHVGADVDEAGGAEGRDELVGADAAEGGGGDGVEGAVVEDQGRAGGVGFCGSGWFGC